MSVFASDPWYSYWLGVLVGSIAAFVLFYVFARIS